MTFLRAALLLLACCLSPCLAAEALTDAGVEKLWTAWADEELRTFEGHTTLNEEKLGERLAAYVAAAKAAQQNDDPAWKARLLLAMCHYFGCGGVTRDDKEIERLVPPVVVYDSSEDAESYRPSLEDCQDVPVALREEFHYIGCGVLKVGKVVTCPWEVLANPPAALVRNYLFQQDYDGAPSSKGALKRVFLPLWVACLHWRLRHWQPERDKYWVLGSRRFTEDLQFLAGKGGSCAAMAAYWRVHWGPVQRDVDVAESGLKSVAGGDFAGRANLYLGRMFDPTDGPSYDLDKARKYYQQALNAGEERARERLSALPKSVPELANVAALWKGFETGWQGCELVEGPDRRCCVPRPRPNRLLQQTPDLGKLLWPLLDGTCAHEARCMYAACSLWGLGGMELDLPTASYWLGNAHAGSPAIALTRFALAVGNEPDDGTTLQAILDAALDRGHTEASRWQALYAMELCWGTTGNPVRVKLTRRQGLEYMDNLGRSGDRDACWAMVSYYYRNGPADLAIQWLEQLSTLDDPQAHIRLARMRETGVELPRDLRECRRLCELALKHDSTATQAREILRRLDANDFGPDLDASVADLEAHLNAHAELAGWKGFCAGALARWAILREQPQGALLYAACLLQGHECQADPAAALELLLTATESHAANYLIARQWQLQGKDHAGMEAVYRAAAGAGSACSALRLGELAREAGNADDARKWFSQAAEASCIPAMMALAAMQEAGEGAAADKDAALGWYRKAAAAGNKDAEAKVRQLEK